MRYVFLTQYFPPEMGAPQARLFELAKGLKKKGHDVTILTAFPNYPAGKIFGGYKMKPVMVETMDDLRVVRTWIYASHSRSFVKRLMNYFSFVFSSMFFGIFFLKKHDILVCETPPLFLGMAGVFLSFIKRSKMYLYVSDLWPDSAVDLGMLKSQTLIRMSKWLEMSLYAFSAKIVVVTKGIKKILDQHPKLKDKVFVVTNGVNIDFFNPVDKRDARKELGLPQDKFIALYSGNHGIAQNLSTMIKCAELTRNVSEIVYLFVGEGVEKPLLMEMKDKLGLDNVLFMGNRPKKDMPMVISSADLAIIPLKDISLFEKALPSKMFEMMSMSLPIVMSVKGEAAEIITEANCGLNIQPENPSAMEQAVMRLYKDRSQCATLGTNGRKYAESHFSRTSIIEKFEKL